ncbi:hypothetical protein BGZ65_006444, partial [Modicella reniformis]
EQQQQHSTALTPTATSIAVDLTEVLETIFSFLSQYTLKTTVCLVCKRWLRISRRFTYRRGIWNDKYLTANLSDPAAWRRDLEQYQSLQVNLEYNGWGSGTRLPTPITPISAEEEAAILSIQQEVGPPRHLFEIVVRGQLDIQAHRPLLPYFARIRTLRLEFTMYGPLDLAAILKCCMQLENLYLTPFEDDHGWRDGLRPNLLTFQDTQDTQNTQEQNDSLPSSLSSSSSPSPSSPSLSTEKRERTSTSTTLWRLKRFQVRNAHASLETLRKVIDAAPELRVFSFHTRASGRTSTQAQLTAAPVLTNPERQILFEHIAYACLSIQHVRYSVPNMVQSMRDIQSLILQFPHLKEWVFNATDLTLGNPNEDDGLETRITSSSSSAVAAAAAAAAAAAVAVASSSSASASASRANSRTSSTTSSCTISSSSRNRENGRQNHRHQDQHQHQHQNTFHKTAAMVRLRYLCYSINHLTTLEIQTKCDSTTTQADLELAQALHFFLCSSPLLVHLKAPKVIYLTEYLNFSPHPLLVAEEPCAADGKSDKSWSSAERPIIDFWNLYSNDDNGSNNTEEEKEKELEEEQERKREPLFSSSSLSGSGQPQPQQQPQQQPCRPIWACRGLQTLHITFQSSVYDFSPTNRARVVFGYLSLVCPQLRDLWIRHQKLDLGLEGGMCMLARLRWLERLRIQVDTNPELTPKCKRTPVKVLELVFWWLKLMMMVRAGNKYREGLKKGSHLKNLWQWQAKVCRALSKWEAREMLSTTMPTTMTTTATTTTTTTTMTMMKTKKRKGESTTLGNSLINRSWPLLNVPDEAPVEEFQYDDNDLDAKNYDEASIIQELKRVQDSRTLITFIRSLLLKGNYNAGGRNNNNNNNSSISIGIGIGIGINNGNGNGNGNNNNNTSSSNISSSNISNSNNSSAVALDECVWPRLEILDLIFSENFTSTRGKPKNVKASEELKGDMKKLRPGVRMTIQNRRFIDWKHE